MRKIERAGWAFVACAACLGVMSCSSDDADSTTTQGGPDAELVAYLDKEFGLRLTIKSIKESPGPDNSRSFHQELDVTIEGLGTRAISIQETVYPDNLTALFVHDVETGAERYFGWHVADGYIAFGTNDKPHGENANLEVVTVPGGKFQVRSFKDGDRNTVLDESTGGGRAAVNAVEAKLGFGDLPPHILMTAFALAHTSAPEARNVITCSEKRIAAAPTVCAIFEDFCNCAPCLVLKDESVCDKWCPAS